MLSRAFARGLAVRVRGLTKRMFSVKEVSWCSPVRSSKKHVATAEANRTAQEQQQQEQEEARSMKPIEKFGICAACARGSRIMGVNGQLPWNLPEDRKHFVDLTRGKLLVMGRKTFQERPNKSHISHAYDTIVVSTTMETEHDDVNVARSLPEALHLANELIQESKQLRNIGGLACWVVGGERIFGEALNHKSAEEVHLTLVDADIDIHAIAAGSGSTPAVALFPAKYRWDRHFMETSTMTTDAKDGSPSFTTVVYRRKHSHIQG